MKIFLYLIASLLFLTACSSPTKTSQPSSSTTEQSQESESLDKDYQDIVSQYEKAIQVTDFKESDFPLVNPVSLDMARRYSGGNFKMASKVLDLNQDQQDELLIGMTSSTGDGDLTVYVAIYGLVDGKVVDLTKDILEKDTDSFLTLYKNNRLRLDQASSDGKMVNVVYELTASGLKELLYLTLDANQSSDVDDILITDRDGKTYRKTEVDSKLAEVIGHPLDEQLLE